MPEDTSCGPLELSARGQFGQLDNPGDTAINSKRGWLYVPNAGNHNVLRFTLNGTFLAQIGSPASHLAGHGKLNAPYGVTVAARDVIVVADTGNHRLQLFSPKGKLISRIGSQGSAPGQFICPVGRSRRSGRHFCRRRCWRQPRAGVLRA
jgi:tripartite motif-containing protein 71